MSHLLRGYSDSSNISREDEEDLIEKALWKYEEITHPPNLPEKFVTKHGTLFLKQIGKLDRNEPTRIYYVYLPEVKQDVKVPVLFLFHGTDETCLDTELMDQNGDFSWIELAKKGNIMLVFGQATGLHTKNVKSGQEFFQYLWQPGDTDLNYVDALIEMIKLEYGNLIDVNRFHALGFSNGGLFISDLIVKFENDFKSCCNYMGGRTRLNMNLNATKKLPCLIITSQYDDNLIPCRKAKGDFEQDGYSVTYVEIPKQKHQYLSSQTDFIWQFFDQ